MIDQNIRRPIFVWGNWKLRATDKRITAFFMVIYKTVEFVVVIGCLIKLIPIRTLVSQQPPEQLPMLLQIDLLPHRLLKVLELGIDFSLA